jgi:PTS system glucitol/sorbitol-specific IIA component
MLHYRTIVSDVGPEVGALLEGGVLILYSHGAPPELAEVSVLHRVVEASADAPRVGALLRIGDVTSRVTSVGPTAWNKVSELGHVVINFNGSENAERPGEICARLVDHGALLDAMKSGSIIEIVGD